MTSSNRHPHRKLLVLMSGALTIFVLGLGAGSQISNSSGHTAEFGITGPPPPAFIRRGDEIIIPPDSKLRSRLLVEQVTVKNSSRTLLLPASVEADPARTVNILPPVAGKVVKLLVRLGDHVVKGQELATIESGDLAQAYADDDKARAALQHAKRTLERVRGLAEAGAGALKDLEQAESDCDQASAELIRAEARLKQIGVASQPKGKSRLLILTAPMAGSVTVLATASAVFVNDLNASLMTIANLDSVWVTASAPESDIAYIAKGQFVDISFPAYPGEVFHGTVAFVSAVLEPDTRRNKVRITFANPAGKFKPNMFANASFNVAQKSAVFVPNSALLMDNDSTIVLVEVVPWTFVKRVVLPGFGEGDGVRIDQGLNADDRVVVKGGVLLND